MVMLKSWRGWIGKVVGVKGNTISVKFPGGNIAYDRPSDELVVCRIACGERALIVVEPQNQLPTVELPLETSGLVVKVFEDCNSWYARFRLDSGTEKDVPLHYLEPVEPQQQHE